MSDLPKKVKLLTDEEMDLASRKRIHAELKRRRLIELSEWIAYLSLLGGSALVLLIAWWKTEEMLRQPVKFPFAIQYATTQARNLPYELDFSDESNIPAAARRIPRSERRVPYMIVGANKGNAILEAAIDPAQKPLELVVPLGVEPGDWSGILRFRTAEGIDVAALPVSFRVADPWKLLKIGAISFLLFTGIWYSSLVYSRPALRTCLLWMDLTGYERRESPDPRKKEFRVGWIRRWILLPRRHWVGLKEIHPRMPSGRLLSLRRGMLPGKKRIWLKLELDGVETTPLVLAHHWPKSTKSLAEVGGKPASRIDITAQGPFSGQPWCIIGTPDDDGNALAFSILHPDSKLLGGKPR